MKRIEQLLSSDRISLHDCKIRPVKKKGDKWCKKKSLIKGQAPEGDAPWGYVVTIPYCPIQNTYLDDMEGYTIVRTAIKTKKSKYKKAEEQLLLQIVENVKKSDSPKYGIRVFLREKTKIDIHSYRVYGINIWDRILNIVNFSKSKGSWRRTRYN